MRLTLILACILLNYACSKNLSKKDSIITKAAYINESPTINGEADEKLWQNLDWNPLGKNLEDENSDFSGKYKLGWNENGIYILMEIDHEHLMDSSINRTQKMWKNDFIKIYIDEDNSGGLHHYNNNAFAYNVDLNGNVIDLGPDKKPKFYNDHIISTYKTEGKTTRWEFQVKVFSDQYSDSKPTQPVVLIPNKKIGFALEYTDNDYRLNRQNHYASLFMPGEDENQGWINADIFGTLVLTKN